MEEWINLLTGQMSPEAARPLLSQAAKDLHALLELQPQLGEYVLEIIGKRLGDHIDGQTWQSLDNSLANYLGRELAYLLIWLVQTDQGGRLNELEQYASPQAMAFLRTILGLYGVELRRALTLWAELPNNWDSISRAVYYDQLAHTYHMEVRILKYNGEEVLIEGPADSILTLTSYLILTVRLAGASDAFSEANIDLFLGEVGQFLRLLPRERLATFIGELGRETPAEIAQLR